MVFACIHMHLIKRVCVVCLIAEKIFFEYVIDDTSYSYIQYVINEQDKQMYM